MSEDEYPYTKGNLQRLRGLKPAPPPGEEKADLQARGLYFAIFVLTSVFAWLGIIAAFNWVKTLFTGD